jgi:hypothetical protein
METTTKIEEQRDEVIAYARSLHDSLERVQFKDYARFTTIYCRVHAILRDTPPFAITVRRAFNKNKAIAIADENPDIYAGVLAFSIACDLDPDFDYLELAL